MAIPENIKKIHSTLIQNGFPRFWLIPKGRVSGIYMIRNLVNGKTYIGSSVNIKKRWAVHRDHLKRNIHHSIYLQRSYNKYGVESFLYTILEECEPDNYKLGYYEQSSISLFMPEYNVNPIAGRPPELSPENRAKLVFRMSGERSPFFGKKRPDHSERMKGENNSFYGKKHSSEMVHKASLSRVALSEDQAKEALSMLKSGIPQSKIGRHFGVSASSVQRLLSNKIVAYSDFVKEEVDKKEIARLAASGVNNFNSLLTREQVLHIRKLRNVEKVSAREIAKMYRMSESTISAVATYKTYKNIPDEDGVEVFNGRENIVLDTQTGIYYESVKQAAKAKGLVPVTLAGYLCGRSPNKTSLIYV